MFEWLFYVDNHQGFVDGQRSSPQSFYAVFVCTESSSSMAGHHTANPHPFSPWSHVVTLLFAQLIQAIGLNDVCNTLRHHALSFVVLQYPGAIHFNMPIRVTMPA